MSECVIILIRIYYMFFIDFKTLGKTVFTDFLGTVSDNGKVSHVFKNSRAKQKHIIYTYNFFLPLYCKQNLFKIKICASTLLI